MALKLISYSPFVPTPRVFESIYIILRTVEHIVSGHECLKRSIFVTIDLFNHIDVINNGTVFPVKIRPRIPVDVPAMKKRFE
jgi:hypothetical protein